MASFSYRRPHSRHFRLEKKGRSSFIASLRTRVGNEEGTIRLKSAVTSHLPPAFSRRSWIWHLVPRHRVSGPGRLPWLHRASPSATLDKIAMNIARRCRCVKRFSAPWGLPIRPSERAQSPSKANRRFFFRISSAIACKNRPERYLFSPLLGQRASLAQW